jgi:acyl carrier protein
MRDVSQKEIEEIRRTVYDYFAEECDIDVAKITDQTNIIEELEGDSLMLLSLLEIFRKKHGLTIELKALGKHLMKKPASTVGQVIELTTRIVKHGDDILKVDL